MYFNGVITLKSKIKLKRSSCFIDQWCLLINVGCFYSWVMNSMGQRETDRQSLHGNTCWTVIVSTRIQPSLRPPLQVTEQPSPPLSFCIYTHTHYVLLLLHYGFLSTDTTSMIQLTYLCMYVCVLVCVCMCKWYLLCVI